MPKPVVLAVNGIGYILSIELALAADIVVAAASTVVVSRRSALSTQPRAILGRTDGQRRLPP
jgi:enoyl-CoA hydratase/carnithine racemase